MLGIWAALKKNLTVVSVPEKVAHLGAYISPISRIFVLRNSRNIIHNFLNNLYWGGRGGKEG